MSTSNTSVSSLKPIYLFISAITILSLSLYFLYSLNPLATFNQKSKIIINPITINPYVSPYHYDNILDNLFYPYKSDIIKKVDEYEFLRDSLGKADLRLVFNSNIHGDYSKDFHEKLNYFHLLVLIETEIGNRFGGYTSENFTPISLGLISDTIEIIKNDKCSFLFNLDIKKVYDINDESNAITCDDFYTVLFGDDDLFVPNFFLSKEGESNFPKIYGKNAEKNELTGGEKKFKVKSLEAFQVLFYTEFGDEKNKMGEHIVNVK